MAYKQHILIFSFENGDLHKLLEELKEAILTLNRATIMIATSTKNAVETTKRHSSYASLVQIPSGPPMRQLDDIIKLFLF